MNARFVKENLYPYRKMQGMDECKDTIYGVCKGQVMWMSELRQ
jgi:hypothetical protein